MNPTESRKRRVYIAGKVRGQRRVGRTVNDPRQHCLVRTQRHCRNTIEFESLRLGALQGALVVSSYTQNDERVFSPVRQDIVRGRVDIPRDR